MSIIEWCEQGDFVFQVVLWAIEIMFKTAKHPLCSRKRKQFCTFFVRTLKMLCRYSLNFIWNFCFACPSCDWVIYPLPSKTQIYVASVILNEYSQVIDRITPSLKNMEIWEENIFIFFAFRENAENILPNTVAVSGSLETNGRGKSG